MTTTAATLRFHRIEAGRYQADSSTRRYLVARSDKGWNIAVWQLAEQSGVKHTVGQVIEATIWMETKTLAVDVARRYDQLVNEGGAKKFSDLSPIRRAAVDAYDAEAAQR